MQDLKAILEKILEKRLRSYNCRNSPNNSSVLGALKTAVDRGEMSEADLRDEILTLFFAGHDTTAMALCFCLKILKNSSKWHSRLIEKMDDPEGDALLNAFVSECLRLYPPVWSIARRCLVSKDYSELKITNDDLVVIPTWALQRSEKYFKDASEFNPERWLDSNFVDGLSRVAYLPFGFGPRICIGSRLAIVELKTILKSILKNSSWIAFSKTTDSEEPDLGRLPVKAGLTLRLNL